MNGMVVNDSPRYEEKVRLCCISLILLVTQCVSDLIRYIRGQ
jgi:hypothetical protein